MRVLLEFGCFCLLFIEFTVGLIRIRVLFEGGSILRIYDDQTLTNQFQKLINSVQWKGLIFDF